MQLEANQPIGIFDSGMGGLTVAHALARLLPHEQLIYFGDVAHHPYGEKSTAAIQAYSIKICDVLLQQRCKLILIACHSASAAAYELVREYVASKAKVLNVIEPTIDFLREHYAGQRLGLIGTRQTVQSNVYKKKIDELQRGIELQSLATPLLAPMIEEGFAGHPALVQTLEAYLNTPQLSQIQALILGCTHYPLIKTAIAQCLAPQVKLIDSAELTAQAVAGLLTQHHLLRQQKEAIHHFYVSDYTETFVASAKWFFPQAALRFEPYPLWE